MISQAREIEIDADVAQILEWSDDCAFRCPEGRRLKNYLRLFEEFLLQRDEIKSLKKEIGFLKEEIRAFVTSN
jgi:hypothetical protein